MIAANKSIFLALDVYCSKRGMALTNSGSSRWIASDRSHRHFIINAKAAQRLTFSEHRQISRFDLDSRSYLLAVGFDQAVSGISKKEREVDPAFLTVALAELGIRPKATPVEVRQVVEWSDLDADSNYKGHDHQSIASLYPLIRVFDISGTEPEETWSVFFQACIDECEAGATWIDTDLATTLHALCELDARRIPYKVLCRSVFDGDKSSFFLAQYRCLEALYSYSGAVLLAKELEIKASWEEIATALENRLGWHPREEGSLERILQFASSQDLKDVLTTLRKQMPNSPELLVPRAARAIYWLRNSFIHYRPAQHSVDAEAFDWIALCKAMTGIVLDVYHAVFSGRLPDAE
jgi:hypothetical protein